MERMSKSKSGSRRRRKFRSVRRRGEGHLERRPPMHVRMHMHTPLHLFPPNFFPLHLLPGINLLTQNTAPHTPPPTLPHRLGRKRLRRISRLARPSRRRSYVNTFVSIIPLSLFAPSLLPPYIPHSMAQGGRDK
ncbi:hypothetical protein FA13DRAFT_1292359 [Coprinellus micaceus]|uniref:Uncharacterized protein n=1 Tax=Coprinellus micaceus TaxID=71717 RepID=A0A4Y7SSS2_COPMI|nr:hypothetical protein FA13DRAFT_1292359 [Coprinellus micaceus]